MMPVLKGIKAPRDLGKCVRYNWGSPCWVLLHTFYYYWAEEYRSLLFNKLSLCPYMVRKPSISVIRTWQISCDIRKWPHLEVHYRFSFIACLAAILKSEAVLAVFSGNFNSLEETFHDEMLSKSQQVFASAHKDIQRLTWNFHNENSTKKMLLRMKQHTCSRNVVKTKV